MLNALDWFVCDVCANINATGPENDGVTVGAKGDLITSRIHEANV